MLEPQLMLCFKVCGDQLTIQNHNAQKKRADRSPLSLSF